MIELKIKKKSLEFSFFFSRIIYFYILTFFVINLMILRSNLILNKCIFNNIIGLEIYIKIYINFYIHIQMSTLDIWVP